jgi:rod shape-determining protein MreC
VQIDRTGLRSNAFGTGKMEQLILRHLPHNVDVREGDTLITSGLGGVFPPNYPVARITKVERPAGEPFADIIAMPLAQLDKSREVLLVWRNNPPEKADNAVALDEKEPTQRAANDADTGKNTNQQSEQNKPATQQHEPIQ